MTPDVDGVSASDIEAGFFAIESRFRELLHDKKNQPKVKEF